MIGKIISDHFGLTEFLGGTVKPKISFDTEVDDEELKRLQRKIESLDGDEIRIRAAVDESSLRDIDGLADYAVDRGKQGKNINKEGVTKLLDSQIANQAHGFLGVRKAIKSYNEGLKDTNFNTNKFIKTISTSNASLGNYLTGLKGATGGIIGYGGSLVTATIKTFALEAATTALNAVISFGVSLAIDGLISLITSYII